nr:hypothetical protein [Aminipila terrae]
MISILKCGLPSDIYLAFVLFELGFPPLLLWQKCVIR